MEKIYYDNSTYIWKTKLNRIKDKAFFLKEAYSVIDSMPNLKTDGFSYKSEWNENLDFIGDFVVKTKLDEIIKIGINECKKLHKEKNINYNKINTDAWINVVRSVEPVQIQFKHNELRGVDKYHTHTDISKEMESFMPHYTYVYYIQMPDIMENDDGVLYFRGENKKEYWVRPEEDDLIIMEGHVPHAPNNAPKSKLDRIVIVGNVGFDFIKKEKSLI